MIAGSIESVSISGREFSVAADADTQRKLGGFENETRAMGDGTAILAKTRVPWSITGLTLGVDDLRGDHEFLQNLADSSEYFAVAVTYASGAVFQGTGQISGEFQYSNTNGTCQLDITGPGKMARQS